MNVDFQNLLYSKFGNMTSVQKRKMFVKNGVNLCLYKSNHWVLNLVMDFLRELKHLFNTVFRDYSKKKK